VSSLAADYYCCLPPNVRLLFFEGGFGVFLLGDLRKFAIHRWPGGIIDRLAW
jgi:hypothetical protein